MAKRKRKPHRAQMRQNPKEMAPTSGPKQKARDPEKGEPNRVGATNTGSDAQKPQYAWVSLEYRDADGNPTFPKDLIAGTYQRRFGEVPQDTEIKVHVLAGYKPKPLMLVERKIYRIQRLSVRGWRRSGQIAVEMEGWRNHEADWFNAMRGVRVTISEPGLPGPHNEESDYIISESSFDQKIVKLVDESSSNTEVRLYEGTLDITETWKSAWRRQAAEVLSMGLKLLIVPLSVALGAGLMLLWLGGLSGSENQASPAPATPTEQGVPAPNADAASEQSDEAVPDQPPDVPVRQPPGEIDESNNSIQEGDIDGEGSSPDGDEGGN